MSSANDHRICFVGDSFTQGTCDPECRGWVGRVAAAGRTAGFDLTAYNLGVRRDTSRDVLARWLLECEVRFRFECAKYVVFSFGTNDTKIEEGKQRIERNESLANFRAILTPARSMYQCTVIGPVPVGDAAQNERVLELCSELERESAALGIPYLPVAQRLLTNTRWLDEVRSNDGSHPGAEGYAALAAMVLDWREWWFMRAG
ncbi:GDSL-type esterase/lipase family protein [Oxalobacteraceae bacterium R-40]|uniref:GDSL-type esterase/lipase family protein n=1 Tax=Keguizhuia sedimenti TaxID=3064264 RepID=A0ABU1BN34_9BURK|nr:GDSL-type esterase/lipase family protein [Oxalobacteraceae bacterium R-40]